MPQINSSTKRHDVLIVPLTTEQADRSLQRLLKRAAEEGWGAARLRSKRGWVTRRTVGWKAPSARDDWREETR
jgi:hypothetical protein